MIQMDAVREWPSRVTKPGEEEEDHTLHVGVGRVVRVERSNGKNKSRRKNK